MGLAGVVLNVALEQKPPPKHPYAELAILLSNNRDAGTPQGANLAGEEQAARSLRGVRPHHKQATHSELYGGSQRMHTPGQVT